MLSLVPSCRPQTKSASRLGPLTREFSPLNDYAIVPVFQSKNAVYIVLYASSMRFDCIRSGLVFFC